jgi:hypothetical protein
VGQPNEEEDPATLDEPDALIKPTTPGFAVAVPGSISLIMT